MVRCIWDTSSRQKNLVAFFIYGTGSSTGSEQELSIDIFSSTDVAMNPGCLTEHLFVFANRLRMCG